MICSFRYPSCDHISCGPFCMFQSQISFSLTMVVFGLFLEQVPSSRRQVASTICQQQPPCVALSWTHLESRSALFRAPQHESVTTDGVWARSGQPAQEWASDMSNGSLLVRGRISILCMWATLALILKSVRSTFETPMVLIDVVPCLAVAFTSTVRVGGLYRNPERAGEYSAAVSHRMAPESDLSLVCICNAIRFRICGTTIR